MNQLLCIPSKQNLLKTLTLLTVFCVPLCGTAQLFGLLAALILSVIVLAVFTPSKPLLSSLKLIRTNHPLAFHAGIAWLCFTFISLLIVLLQEHTAIRKFAGIARQLYILLEIGFALVIIHQLSSRSIQSKNLLFSLAAGFFTLVSYQSWAIYFHPIQQSSFWSWTPLMAPNIRDTGTIASAITGAFFCLTLLEKRPATALIFLSLTSLSWTYLMWTGGRTGNAAIIIVLLLICLLQTALTRTTAKGFLIFIITGFIAFNLSNHLAVYDWNGFQRIENKFSHNIFELNENNISKKAPLNSETVNTENSIKSVQPLTEEKIGHREIMWSKAWQAFKRSPVIGLGPNGWFFSPEKKSSGAIQDQPHNIVLQALVEWGLVGSCLFFMMLAGFILPKLKHLKTAFGQAQITYISSGSMILVLSLHSLTSGTYWNFQSVTVVVLAYSVWINWQERRDD
ncbi:MAG: O-antigen ligase family protein [Sinobacterium sp.]|nr:O-antigen ligase family protein [Sinobacterium sp.]